MSRANWFEKSSGSARLICRVCACVCFSERQSRNVDVNLRFMSAAYGFWWPQRHGSRLQGQCSDAFMWMNNDSLLGGLHRPTEGRRKDMGQRIGFEKSKRFSSNPSLVWTELQRFQPINNKHFFFRLRLSELETECFFMLLSNTWPFYLRQQICY